MATGASVAPVAVLCCFRSQAATAPSASAARRARAALLLLLRACRRAAQAVIDVNRPCVAHRVACPVGGNEGHRVASVGQRLSGGSRAQAHRHLAQRRLVLGGQRLVVQQPLHTGGVDAAPLVAQARREVQRQLPRQHLANRRRGAHHLRRSAVYPAHPERRQVALRCRHNEAIRREHGLARQREVRHAPIVLVNRAFGRAERVDPLQFAVGQRVAQQRAAPRRYPQLAVVNFGRDQRLVEQFNRLAVARDDFALMVKHEQAVLARNDGDMVLIGGGREAELGVESSRPAHGAAVGVQRNHHIVGRHIQVTVGEHGLRVIVGRGQPKQPASASACRADRMHEPAVRAEKQCVAVLDQPALNVIVGAVRLAPEGFPATGVEGVQLAAPRADIQHALIQHRSGGRRAVGGEHPAQAARVDVQRQHIPVARAHIDQPVALHRLPENRGVQRCIRGVLPLQRAALQIHRVQAGQAREVNRRLAHARQRRVVRRRAAEKPPHRRWRLRPCRRRDYAQQ
jgi:hypothetical protein